MTNGEIQPPPLATPAPPERRHSGFGIAAFVIAVVAGPAMLLTFFFAGLLHVRGVDQKGSAAVMVVGLLVIGCGLAQLVGIGLAIAGLCQQERRKVFPVLGLVLNGAIVLGTIGLMVLGVVMKK